MTHVYRVHYDRGTGKIQSCEFTNVPSAHPGYDYIDAKVEEHVAAASHRVDLASKTIVPLTEDEKRILDAPTLSEVQSAVRAELAATDRTQLPDFPLKHGTVEQWRAYRHALRRLSDLGTPAPMIGAWPLRPDGADAIPLLRKRLA